MNAAVLDSAFFAPQQVTHRYAKVIEASKRIRWDIDRDVLRNRKLDFGRKFLPDGLSLAADLAFLSPAEQRFLSHAPSTTWSRSWARSTRWCWCRPWPTRSTSCAAPGARSRSPR